MRRSVLALGAMALACVCSCGGRDAGSERSGMTAAPDLHDPAVMQGRIVRLIERSRQGDSIRIKKELTGFFESMKHDSGAMTLADSLVDAYLNNPNSPLRDEGRFMFFIESMLEVDTLPEAIRERSRERLRIARMNRPGMVAADFDFIDRKGRRHSLHDAVERLTLLVFYDPECPHCSDQLRQFADAPEISEAMLRGVLDVTAIYAEGKRDVWDRTKRDLPNGWKVGFDKTGILDSDLYDLPAMPTVYLLDSDSRVILKDPAPTVLLRVLEAYGQPH